MIDGSLCKASLFGAHKFKPRYNTTLKEPVSHILQGVGRASGDAVDAIIEGNKEQEYVCDVCVKCGLIVNRD